MSQTVSNTINVAVNLEGADDVVVKAQETAQELDAVAESSQAVQTATINEVAEAVVDGEKKRRRRGASRNDGGRARGNSSSERGD